MVELSSRSRLVSGEPELSSEGLDGVIVSNVPVGAGLSSSAAFELASAWAFLIASRIWPRGFKDARLPHVTRAARLDPLDCAGGKKMSL